MKLIICCLSSLLWTSSLFAAGASPYIGIAAGIVSAEDSGFTASDGITQFSGELEAGDGGLLEVAGGIDFDGAPVRIEAAMSILVSEVDKVDFDGATTAIVEDGGFGVAAFMLNGYIDIPTGTFLEPYAFAGVGRATVITELNDEDVDDQVGAFQFGGGLGVTLTEYFILDFKYRYFEIEDFTLSHTDDRLKAGFSSHQFLAGFRVRF